MNKAKSFLMGIVLLVITFIIVVLVALIYRANDRISIKSYIFQINNFAAQRVGELQDMNDISAEVIRNKLIKTYVSEYFKVIPGETDVEKRKVLYNLSDRYTKAFEQWQNGEAKTIAQMSANNMLRIVHVHDEDITALNKPANYNFSNQEAAIPIYYAVRYHMITWPKPNEMDVQPIFSQGTINIEAVFKMGIRETIEGKKYNLKEYLESGKNPAGLFQFKVTNIGDKGIK